jgi:hypothetical protein
MTARSGDVFRAPKRDRFGDPVDEDGNPVSLVDKDGLTFMGTLTDIVMGGLSAARSRSRGETVDTSGMIGCRVDLEPRLQFGDRIVIDGVKYEVASVPEWGYGHSFSGSQFFNRYWVDVKARG